jgi:hypothetical protein
MIGALVCRQPFARGCIVQHVLLHITLWQERGQVECAPWNQCAIHCLPRLQLCKELGQCACSAAALVDARHGSGGEEGNRLQQEGARMDGATVEVNRTEQGDLARGGGGGAWAEGSVQAAVGVRGALQCNGAARSDDHVADELLHIFCPSGSKEMSVHLIVCRIVGRILWGAHPTYQESELLFEPELSQRGMSPVRMGRGHDFSCLWQVHNASVCWVLHPKMYQKQGNLQFCMLPLTSVDRWARAACPRAAAQPQLSQHIHLNVGNDNGRMATT